MDPFISNADCETFDDVPLVAHWRTPDRPTPSATPPSRGRPRSASADSLPPCFARWRASPGVRGRKLQAVALELKQREQRAMDATDPEETVSRGGDGAAGGAPQPRNLFRSETHLAQDEEKRKEFGKVRTPEKAQQRNKNNPSRPLSSPSAVGGARFCSYQSDINAESSVG